MMKLGHVCLLCFFFGFTLGEPLYGLIIGDKAGYVQVAKISSGHGIHEPIAFFPDLHVITDNKCTFDQQNGVIYIVGTNTTTSVKQVVGVSLHNGDLLSASPVPAGVTALQLAFNQNNGHVVYTATSDHINWAQYSLDPATGVNTLLNTYVVNGTFGVFLGSGAAFDPVNSIQWLPCVDSFGLSTMCGLGLDGTNYVLPDPNEVLAPVYSFLPDGTMYSFGFSNEGRSTTQWKSTDPYTQSIATLADDWFIAIGGVNAYSNATGTMYSVFSHHTGPHYYLVGVDVQTGQTKSAPVFDRQLYCLGYIFS